MINVLLIGCGYHARRIYVPHLAEQKNARLSAIVDLASQKENIEGFLTDKTITGIDFYYTDNNMISDDLSSEEVKKFK